MKYLSNHIPIIKRLLHQLGLHSYENSAELGRLPEAVQWALTDTGFVLKKYEITPLRPVLETLKGNVSSNFIKPKELSIELEMPSSTLPSNLEAYFNAFKEALNKAQDEQILTILEIWASSIATSEKYCDLSLFDFIRTSVGITACLENGNGKIRLAGGSISGIQTYLYEIISKNAAKLLKGRSFYIQLLVDSLLDELLKEFDLSPCHVVYSSGGGFYVFMPDTEGVVNDFKKFAKKMSEAIYDKHKIALSVDLALTDAFESSKNIDEVWNELFTQLGQLKFKRLNNNDALLNAFFEKAEFGGTRDKDPITNDEIGINDEIDRLLDGTKVLKSTKQQIELGKDLRNANYWIVSRDKIKGLKETIKDPLSKFHYLKESLPPSIGLNDKTVFEINKTTDNNPFVFYGGNEFPITEEGYAKPFDELIENDSFTRLAILRMDVDGLGGIFSTQKNITSGHYNNLNWTRYVSVSRSLDQFFKGYLNHLQREVEAEIKAQETSVIIYSGGDDLFLVGRWDTVLALSQAIYQKFKAWSNGVLTISGGLELLPAKFPIMQGARLAAGAEEKAKKHQYPTNTEGGQEIVYSKNAITLFGKPLNWEHEFSIVNKLQGRLYDFIEPKSNTDKKIDRSIVSKINIHADAQRDYLEKQLKKEKASPKWMWLIAYDITQMRDRFDKNETTIRDFLDELKNASISNQYDGKRIKSNYPFLQLLQLAARWAELRYRANQKES